MNGWKIVIGVTTLCALALSAISTSDAFAGATAFTCVAGAGEHKAADQIELQGERASLKGEWIMEAGDAGGSHAVTLTTA